MASVTASTVNKDENKQQYIIKKLMQFHCPIIETDDEAWLPNLFEPSEARLRIITWLIGQFDVKLGNLITKPSPAADNHIDSRMQRLLFVCSFIGLCQAGDLEIIKGTSSKKKQLTFWTNLLEFVSTSEQVNNPGHKESHQPELIGYSRNDLPEKDLGTKTDYYEHLCRFTDNLARQERVNDLFDTSVRLFPPDLERLFVDDSKNPSASTPDNKVLEDIVEKLAVDVKASEKEYDQLRKKFQAAELCQSDIDQHCKKLSLAITMLRQLITNFLHCYEINLKQWCNRPKAKKSGLGQTCRRTFQMAMTHDDLLTQMEVLENSYQTIKREISEHLEKRTSNSEIGHESLMNLRQVIDILRESELRIRDDGLL
eukprot:gene15772-17363_t